MRRTRAAVAVGAALLLAGCGSGGAATPEAGSSATPQAAETSTPVKAEMAAVPDVVGMTIEEATAALAEAGFRTTVSGDGQEVTSQVPAAGKAYKVGESVMVAAHVPEPDGTRANPFEANAMLTATLTAGGEVSIGLGVANWDATEAVMAENQFNDEAPDGSTWVLLPVTIVNVSAPDAINPSRSFFVSYVAPDGRSFDEASAVIPGDLIDVGDLYEGGVAEGNMGFTIPTDALGGLWAVKYGYGGDPVFVIAN